MDAAPSSLEDRAKVDGMALFLAHWRGSLVVKVLITAAVAVAWQGLVPWRANAAWCACAGLAYLGQAVVLWKLQRSASLAQAMPRWMPWMWVAMGFSGCVWGAVPWVLSSASWQAVLFAGAFNVMLMFMVANAPGTRGMLWSTAAPFSVLTTAALAAHEGLAYAAFAVGTLFALILFYGLRVRRTIQAAMVQRHVAMDLADELREHQQRLLVLETERAVQQEREQLMRSMHDGLGSTLVSALSLAEHARLEPGEMVDVLRECVDDVRLVVDSLECAEHDLTTLLASLRHRWVRRLEASGLALEWEVDDLPPLHWLTPAAALQVLRIVQEALANVIKHARARRLSMAVRAETSGVRVLIEDDGVGFDATASAPHGRGLRHMPERAAQLGAVLTVDSRPGRGTRVCLDLPLRAPNPAAPCAAVLIA